MSSTRSMSMRTAVVSGSLALALSAFAAPVAMAQDEGPESAAYNFAAAIEAKELANLAPYFCAEFAAEADRFDFAGAMGETMGEGFEVSIILEALDFDIEGLEVSVIEQAEDTATLGVEGSMTMSFNPDGVRPLLSFILESQMGTEVTDDMIDMLVTPDMLAQIEGQFAAESQDLSTDAMEVVLEADGVWRICSSLDDAMGGENMEDDA